MPTAHPVADDLMVGAPASISRHHRTQATASAAAPIPPARYADVPLGHEMRELVRGGRLVGPTRPPRWAPFSRGVRFGGRLRSRGTWRRRVSFHGCGCVHRIRRLPLDGRRAAACAPERGSRRMSTCGTWPWTPTRPRPVGVIGVLVVTAVAWRTARGRVATAKASPVRASTVAAVSARADARLPGSAQVGSYMLGSGPSDPTST
jgi:hypothetical protein